MGLSETWLDSTVSNSEIGVSGFHIYRRDRSTRGGGILVYVSEDVKCVRRQDLEGNWIEALWLEVKLKKKKLLVCNIYRPPDAKIEWMEHLQEMVEIGIQEKKPTIIMGDFNCDMLSLNSSTVRLKIIMSEYGMTQMVKCPTRVTATSSTQIDLKLWSY